MPSGTITLFPLPTTCGQATCGTTGITTGPDGTLWFTENTGNKIGRITLGGKVTGFSAPTDPMYDATGTGTADLSGTIFLLIKSNGPF
jgi:streptogramin lyase